MNKSPAATALAASLIAVVAVASAPASASSGGDDGVRASGSCSAGAQWKLKAKHDDGRVEWEFEVDSNRSGQTWKVRVRDNGDLVMKGRRVTRPPSGSFSVERKTANRAGPDRIVAVARRVGGGQVCRGRVTL